MAVFQAATTHLLLSALPRNGGIAVMLRKSLLLLVLIRLSYGICSWEQTICLLELCRRTAFSHRRVRAALSQMEIHLLTLACVGGSCCGVGVDMSSCGKQCG